TELLDSKLQSYNDCLYQKLSISNDLAKSAENYLKIHRIEGLRVTLIKPNGEVFFDSQKRDLSTFSNHAGRVEIRKALQTGTGFDINRTSETVGRPYFYSAKYYDKKFIIRSALPYNINLINNLKADSHFVWFTLIITLLLVFFFYKFTAKLGTSISQLREFAMHADRNEAIEMQMHSTFPHNELGDISQHIIQIYRHLHETKEALYIEREKLITHLQISHEGLGIFSHNKQEILVNNLFTQYSNLISDCNLTTSEEMFDIPELQEITRFINQCQQRPVSKKEERLSITIDKNGKVFTAECIIFQDLSFEISLNDVTQEEEQVRLKRQLTQNIAHELKTPVSSIQGYLETIITNKNLPKEKLDTFLERCYAQSNRLTRLLRDISVLTRIDEASNMIDMEEVSINTLMSNIINEVALELEQKEITVHNLLPDNVHLKGNNSLIYSIFRNLTDNAIAYAGTGINITVQCFREDDSYYYFSFADNGVGVAPEHLNRLFERFYRVDKGRSRKLGGTGLGLAIVKNAVIIHGGNISAKLNQSGGLEFVFTLKK
ncbi:MAG: ATP-binding protein, partial [Bacteroides sp.]